MQLNKIYVFFFLLFIIILMLTKATQYAIKRLYFVAPWKVQNQQKIAMMKFGGKVNIQL